MKSRVFDRRQFIWLTTCAVSGGCFGVPASLAVEADKEGWNPRLPLQNAGQRLRV